MRHEGRERDYALRISVYQKKDGKDTAHVLFGRGILDKAGWSADYLKLEVKNGILSFQPVFYDEPKTRANPGVAKICRQKFYDVAQFSRAEELVPLLDWCGEYDLVRTSYSCDGTMETNWFVYASDKHGYTELHSCPAERKSYKRKPAVEKPEVAAATPKTVTPEAEELPTWKTLLQEEIEDREAELNRLETERKNLLLQLSAIEQKQRKLEGLIDTYTKALHAGEREVDNEEGIRF